MSVKRLIAVTLILITVASLLVGCSNAPNEQGQPKNTIQTFRDIPDITTDEIAAIEKLINERDSFSFGALFSTYAFELPDGTGAGFFPLLCELLSDLFGIPFIIEFDDWDAINENLNDFSLDFTGELTPTPARREKYHMTSAIAEHTLSAFILNDGMIEVNNAESLNGLNVAYWSNSITELIFLTAYPDIVYTSLEVDTASEAAEKLLSGEIDVFMAPSVDAYTLKDYPFIIGREVFPFCYAIAALATANPELEPIISAVESFLLSDGFYQIHDLHIEGRRDFAKYNLYLSFTDDEIAFINDMRERDIKIPILKRSSWYPITFFNEADDEFQGIAKDILTEITLLTGLQFEVVNDKNTTGLELRELLFTGQAAMISDLWHSDDIKDDFLWADEPYKISNFAFLSKIDTPYTDFLLPLLRTGAVRGTVFETVYHTFFPESENLFLYDLHSDALTALEADEIDLLLTSDFLLLYQTNYRERPDYKINVLLSHLTGESFFGFNKSYKNLSQVISKSQRYADIDRIVLRWTSRSFDYERKLAEERADDANQRAVTFLITMSVLFVLFLMLAFLIRKNKVTINKLHKTSSDLEVAVQQTKAASRAKSDFLSNMSHEIRTPLNAIVGMTVIGKKAADLENKNNALGKIEDASSHLLGVINDVLDMAKIEADKLELAPTSFIFEKMLQKAINTIHYRANEKNHTLTVNVDKSIPRYIVADEQRLAQIIINLLTNAVKFTPPGGHISINASLIDNYDDTLKLRIEVSDTGIGISPDQQDKLFEAFEQANSGVNREFGGTGLGLSIAKRIVEMMGGRIWVESEFGKGAKFVFVALAARSDIDDDIERDEIKTGTTGSFSGKRLLIAEDIQINTDILIALLEDTGLEIDCVENGQEALDAITAQPDKYDIVFMDLQMPVMDGLEATRRIRTLPGHNRDKLVIIAMTANVFQEDINNCLAAGMDDHISKPLDIEILLGKLQDYLL
ncbi:MAG: ATP-binding protein [Oscillospiraceae bacterium]|nr:ATP-binding protein [Oscillospiraceae bacterium]